VKNPSRTCQSSPTLAAFLPWGCCVRWHRGRGRIQYYQFVSKEGITVQAFTAGDAKPESVWRLCQLVGYANFWSLRHKLSIDCEEDSHSGLVRTPGTRVG